MNFVQVLSFSPFISYHIPSTPLYSYQHNSSFKSPFKPIILFQYKQAPDRGKSLVSGFFSSYWTSLKLILHFELKSISCCVCSQQLLFIPNTTYTVLFVSYSITKQFISNDITIYRIRLTKPEEKYRTKKLIEGDTVFSRPRYCVFVALSCLFGW